MREQKIRLYIVPGVDESTQFETLTRKEISVSKMNLPCSVDEDSMLTFIFEADCMVQVVGSADLEEE